MRRLLAVVLVAFFGFPLLAASPPALSIKPVVIVYPFIATGSSIDREASSRLATIIATQMANTGQVAVTPPPPGTERKDYLTTARDHAADYYVAGYISPLGTGVSVVEQVVSVSSGIVVFSQSAQLSTYGEASSQGDDLATFIARYANRGLAAIGTPPPAANSPTPNPSNGPEANLGKLFGRKKKPAATPSPSPVPTAAKQQVLSTAVVPKANSTATPAPKTVAAAGTAAAPLAVVAVAGTADAALREYALQRLVARTGGERAQTAAAACAAHAVRAVLSGNLAVRSDGQSGGSSATFELIATDCAGKVLSRQSFSNDAGGAQGAQVATDRAVDAAVVAYVSPPAKRRR